MLAVAYATGRVSHARQVKGDDPDKKGYPGPSGWGLCVRLTSLPLKKILLRDLKRRPRPTQGCRADDDDDDGETKAYCSEVLQAIPAYSSDKGRLEARYSVGEMKKLK
jgi:hypothetical protein